MRVTTNSGLAARRAVLDALVAVLNERRSLDEFMYRSSAMADLPTYDRAFARLIIQTVLRRLPEIDSIYGKYLSRPLPDRPRELKHLLRMGTVQLVHLKTRPHAAVDTCVTLADRLHNQKFKGLINAILRKVAANDVVEDEDTATVRHGRLNTPEWLSQSWDNQFGVEDTDAICRQHLKDPPLDITVKKDAVGWARTLDAELLPTGSLRYFGGGDPSKLPGFNDGDWWIQDAAAALPVSLLGDLTGKTVIDLCAAPGGKTAQLAAAGASVTAVDISEQRLERLKRNIARLHLNVDTVVADLRNWRPDVPADIVLLDAPCTATGTCRRHPDILRNRQPEDVEKLRRVQESLLASAREMVAPDGKLVYVTCSLQREEGLCQVEKFLDCFDSFEVEPFEPGMLPDLEAALTPEGMLRTLPGHWSSRGGMDGFFAVALRRVS